jgi:hypothetical protein
MRIVVLAAAGYYYAKVGSFGARLADSDGLSTKWGKVAMRRIIWLCLLVVLTHGVIANAAVVEWVTDQDGAWEAATNWSSFPSLPGELDDVVVSVSDVDITVRHYVGQHAVRSLNSTEKLDIRDGSLTVLGGSSSLHGGVLIPQGLIRASGDGTSLSVESLRGGDQIDVSPYIWAANGADVSVGGEVSGKLWFVTEGEGSAIGFPNADLSSARISASALDHSMLTFEQVVTLNHSDVSAFGGGVLTFPNVRDLIPGANPPEIVADGNGSYVDLANLESFHIHTGGTNEISRIYARQGGRIDLGGQIVGQGNRAIAEIDVRGPGSVLSMPDLQQFPGSYRPSTLTAADGGLVQLPELTHYTKLNLYAESGGVIELPSLQVIRASLPDDRAPGAVIQAKGAGTVIDLSAASLLDGGFGFAALDGATIRVAGKVDGGGRLTLRGADSRFDWSKVTEWTGGLSIVVQNGATFSPLEKLESRQIGSLEVHDDASHIELSEVTELTSPLLALNHAVISLPNLERYSIESGFVQATGGGHIDLSAARHLEIGRFFVHTSASVFVRDGGRVDLPNVILGNAKLYAEQGGTITARDLLTRQFGNTLTIYNSTLALSGSWHLQNTDEPEVQVYSATVQFAGGGLQSLEVAGEDLGVEFGGSLGNFGIGQLVVGDASSPTRLNLVEIFDNANRADGKSESLYLYQETTGLRVHPGSIMHLNSSLGSIQVYMLQGDSFINLQSLFPGPNSTIPFDEGFISNVLLGDFDLDGAVTAADLEALRTVVREGDGDESYDLNLSGVVDQTDFEEMLDDVLFTVAGDGNLDGMVDLFDLNLVRNQFGEAGDWSTGDFDGDGVIGLTDLNAVRNNFGFNRTLGGAMPVPEPSTLALLFIVCAAGGWRWRARIALRRT